MRRVRAFPLAALLLLPSSVSAVTWRVPSQCPTIQAGMDSASAGDTVLVAPGTYYEHDIIVTSGICLQSETGVRDGATIDAERRGRVLRCTDVEDTVRVQGITFAHGSAERGGGVWCRKSRLVLDECGFSQNVASSRVAESGFGGAIFCDSCSATLRGCVFWGNVATSDQRDAAWGGAVHSLGSSLTLTECVLSGNLADGWYPDAGLGGGIYAAGSSLVLVDCDISRNAGVSGGGTCCAGGSLTTLAGCTLSENEAYGYDIFDGYGGGLAVGIDSSGTVISDCTFTGNLATGGGGALAGGAAVTGSMFTGNRGSWGGAVLGEGSFSHCMFWDNVASDGGAILGAGSFSYCVFSKNVGGDGSAMSVSDPVEIINCTFCRNSGMAAVYCDFISRDSVFRNSLFVFGSGPALSSRGYPLPVPDPQIDGCDIYGNDGGDWVGWLSIYNDEYYGNFSMDPRFCHLEDADLRLCDLSPCLPENNPRGVLVGALANGPCECRGYRTLTVPGDYPTIAEALSQTTINDTVLVHPGTYAEKLSLPTGVVVRSAAGRDSTIIDGGGKGTTVLFEPRPDDEDKVSDLWTTLEGFTITGGAQSGVSVSNKNLLLSGCRISGNVGRGSGIRCTDGTLRVVGCEFSSNEALDGSVGGGLQCIRMKSVDMEGCTFSSNRAAYGGGAYFSGSTVRIRRCEFADNAAENQGGGVYGYQSAATLDSCVFRDNAASEGGGLCGSVSSSEVTHCTFAGNLAGTGGGVCFRSAGTTEVRPQVSCCTFFANEAPVGAAITCMQRAKASVKNSIVARSSGGEAVWCDAQSQAVLRCSDVFSNTGGDWVGAIQGQMTIRQNFSADPRFCNPDSGDFHLDLSSPCAPENAGTCGWIGALGTACENLPPELTLRVLQDPHLGDFLDLCLVSSEDLDSASVVLRVGTDTIAVSRGDETGRVWAGRYELTAVADSVSIQACASDPWGKESCLRAEFSAAPMTAALGGAVTSPDGRLRIRIGPRALDRDGYVLVLPGGDVHSHVDRWDWADGHKGQRAVQDWQEELASYRVSPEGILTGGPALLEFSYFGMVLEAESADRIVIEREGWDRLDSFVDPQRQIVTATVSDFGIFRLALGEAGSSRRVDPRFVRVEPNFPNPFASTTTIRFEIRDRQWVRASIFDVAGREVARLVDRVTYPGTHEITWDGRSDSGQPAAPGVYFYRVSTEHAESAGKMLLVR